VPLILRDLGRTPYAEAYALQKALLEARIRGEGDDVALIVEHDPVFTLGRRRGAADNVLVAGDVPVIQVERGGDVTFHGPGQLVVYPILALPPGRQDLHRHLKNLEEIALRTCAAFGLDAARDPRNTGAWVGGHKIASVGVACRSWVTWHGLALNVHPDMRYFARINPCGLSGDVMTSMAQELGAAPDWEAVKAAIMAATVAVFEEDEVRG
jgi:lipoyl(octanoyl) transferase